MPNPITNIFLFYFYNLIFEKLGIWALIVFLEYIKRLTNRVHDSNVSKYYLAKFMLIGLRNQRYSTYPVLLEETSQIELNL